MKNPYDERYDRPGYYWGNAPSPSCYRVLQLLPPDRPLRLLDIGCGEGRNAVFFARNGYKVSAFDTSPTGVEKTARRWISGELLTYYHEWKIEFCTEEIFDCMSSGVAHQHAVNRMVARKQGASQHGATVDALHH